MHPGQVLVAIAQVVLAELAGRIASSCKSSAIVGSSFCNPNVAPGKPTLVMPVRNPDWPVMNDALPAVQLCSRSEIMA
jgi:hypothetical protein